MTASYLKLLQSGELEHRIDILSKVYNKCRLCPHQCKVDRTKGERGICRSGGHAVVASYTLHHGEEPPVSGHSGSGTIFFSGCTGRCIFCQNYPISQLGTGTEVSNERLAEIMIELQSSGCHNINLVTPTHFIPSIVKAISLAAARGLHVPIVYNTSGYESSETLKLLDSIIDIYLPDAKYADNDTAEELSGFTDYVEYNRSALLEMFNQVGNLQTVDGIAVKGILVLHLILPDGLSGTDKVLQFLSVSLSKNVYVSLMDQYFPAYKAVNHENLSRRITLEEYQESLESLTCYGLHEGWIQEHL